MSRRQELLESIAKEKDRLASLEQEGAEIRARLEALRRELAEGESGGAHSFAAAADAVPETPNEKVALFASLFRGRADVFARRWENWRTEKTGYAPACANEWVRGVCEKPRIRCGECPNQAFLPLSDGEILAHLQGRQVVGLYPLLQGESCWLLAADFDKASWKEDVLGFAETCRARNVPVAIERSRSGNGAHAWIFFTSPVPASTARRAGCALLTETMARRHTLAMESYDRLFPNQDTLPRGGFGSLIALPLQLDARSRGNTVFLDQDLAPFADQWACLASVERVTPEHMEQIAEDAAREGRIIGVRMPHVDDVEDPTPWTRRPSGRPQRLPVGEPLPQQIRAILAQRLFVEKAGIPSPLLNRIKRLAAFQNPEFYKRQSLRLSTALTPRVIACAEEHSHHVSLPRGCEDDLRALLSEHGVLLEVEDEREEGEKIALEFRGELTAPQKDAAQAILRDDIGLFVAPPGAGKTVVGSYLVTARGRSTLVLVHRKPLLDQWVAQLSLFLGLPAARIGRIAGGRSRPKGDVDVAMLQSLVRKESVADIVATYGHVIVDECHHVPAVSFERVLNEVRARYITGLTATPYRRDGQHPILHMQCGPVRSSMDPRSPGGRRPFERRLLARETQFDSSAEDGIQKLYAALASDQARNALILSDVRAALEEGRSPIVLTERRDHLERLADGLRAATPHVVVLRGGGTAKGRRETADQIDAIGEAPGRVLLATGRYAGEGFDDARLDTLFLALPVSWKGTLVQYAGRLHRLHQGKKEVRVYDYVDGRVPLLRRMFERRLRGYRAIGYELVETGDQALGAL